MFPDLRAGDALMVNTTGRWLLPVCGPSLIVAAFATSRDENVKSIVDTFPVNGFTLMPRFFGIIRHVVRVLSRISCID